jgi:hypothetical protein
MKERDEESEPFWTIDEELCELPLLHGGEPTSYSVRIKAHLQHSSYNGNRELYPLQTTQGTKVETTARAYILVPDIMLTVDLYREVLPAGDIGEVVGSQWQGMRHEELARIRGLYYVEDRALGIWEVDAAERLDLTGRLTLWQGFEDFLKQHHPDAQRIYTDDAEPGDNEADNRDFLRSLDYRHLPGAHRIFAKDLLESHS